MRGFARPPRETRGQQSPAKKKRKRGPLLSGPSLRIRRPGPRFLLVISPRPIVRRSRAVGPPESRSPSASSHKGGGSSVGILGPPFGIAAIPGRRRPCSGVPGTPSGVSLSRVPGQSRPCPGRQARSCRSSLPRPCPAVVVTPWSPPVERGTWSSEGRPAVGVRAAGHPPRS